MRVLKGSVWFWKIFHNETLGVKILLGRGRGRRRGRGKEVGEEEKQEVEK